MFSMCWTNISSMDCLRVSLASAVMVSVFRCGYLKFSDREALNRIDWIMSRGLVWLVQPECLRSTTVPKGGRPLQFQVYSSLRAGCPVDVGSLVMISSIILSGGFACFFKAARLRFLFAQLLLCLYSSKKKRGRRLPL